MPLRALVGPSSVPRPLARSYALAGPSNVALQQHCSVYISDISSTRVFPVLFFCAQFPCALFFCLMEAAFIVIQPTNSVLVHRFGRTVRHVSTNR